MVPLGIMKSERIKMASRTKLHTMIIWPRCEKLRRGRSVRKYELKTNCLTKKKEFVMETNDYKKAVNNAVELIKAGDFVSEWDACGIGEEKENEAWSEAWSN